MALSDVAAPPPAPTYNFTQAPQGPLNLLGQPLSGAAGVGTASNPGYPPAPPGGYAPPTNWNSGGNSIASGQLQQATPVEQQQAQYAQQMAGYYQGQVPGALGIQGPQIGQASTAATGASQAQLGQLASAYGQVASGQGPMGQLAQNQLQSGIGQSLASNLALAHSASGPLGGAAAMRAAQEQNAQTTAGAAGASGLLAAQQQQAGLAGQAGAEGQLANLNQSLYGTQQGVLQNQAQLSQQQTGQNEQYAQNLANTALNQQQVANQATQSLAGLGVQAGLGEAGTAVGAQNATTALIGTGSTLAAGGLSSLSGGLSAASLGSQASQDAAGLGVGGLGNPAAAAIGSDAQNKTSVQAEGNSNFADTPVARSAAGGGQGTVLSSGATTSQEAEDVGGGALKGAAHGAGIGGLVGSIIPAIGTAIGAGVGAGIGAGVGAYTGGQGNRNISGVSQGGLTSTMDINNNAGANLIGGGAAAAQTGIGLAGSLASDKLAKVGATKEGDGGHVSAADEFLDSMHPYSFQYKDPRLEPRAGGPTGGRYLGVMAQDLERAPDVGHQIVFDSPTGKRIDQGAGLSAALAGLARLHERVCDLEGTQ